MITEDYVSFENAKLLKEKGFKIPYDSFRGVYINCIFERLNPGDAYGYNLGDEIVEVCSLQMAMKWLREVHNLHCSVDYDYVLGWYCQITSLKETVEYDYEEMKHYHPEKDNSFSSPEEAYEAAIKYCLENLI